MRIINSKKKCINDLNIGNISSVRNLNLAEFQLLDKNFYFSRSEYLDQSINYHLFIFLYINNSNMIKAIEI